MRLQSLVAVAAIAAAVWLGRDWIAERLRDVRPSSSAELNGAGAERGGATDADRPGGLSAELVELAGRRIEISLLTMEPASHYLGKLVEDDEDDDYRAAVGRAARGAVFDAHLSAAAGELAAQAAALDAVVPDAALEFVLHAAGAPESTVLHFLVRTNSERDDEVDDAIKAALARRAAGPDVVIGVGEAQAQGRALARYIVVVVSRRPYVLGAISRRAQRSELWPLRFAASGWKKLSASVLYPDARVQTFEVRELGSGFAVDIPVGELVGTVAVSIDGRGPDGPGKLGQLSVEVNHELPRSIEVLVPPAEDHLEDPRAAEAYAFDLLSMDRDRYGLAALERDSALDEVARAHSVDMRDAGFFAHLSPTTGLPVERLRGSGYQASASGENIALNDSVAEADAALLASVGHRKNMLSPHYTHVGIGLAKRVRAGRTQWWLTQVFARKVGKVDPVGAREDLLRRLNQRRRSEGMAPVTADAALAAVAQRGAARASSGELDGLASQVGDQARPYASGGALVSVQALYHLSDFASSAGEGAERMSLAGIGVAQARQDGRIGVVLILAADR